MCPPLTVTLSALSLGSQRVPGNWSDSTSYLATISQPVETNLSTIVPEITEGRNITMAMELQRLTSTVSIRMVGGVSPGPPVVNQSVLYEYNSRSQQDQCWETYVGQVSARTDGIG